MLTQLSVQDFLAKTASGDPVPGGGSVSALVAAAGAALAQMVAGLTLGREKFAAVAGQMEDLRSRADSLRAGLTADVDRDSDAYGQVMAAFSLPKDDPGMRGKRRDAIELALVQAARVPMEVAEKALEVIRLAGLALEKGNPNAVTDAAVAVMMARSAALGALLNVEINLKSIKDTELVKRMAGQVATIRTRVVELEKRFLENIDLK